jgi:hypothetical protein
MVIHFFASLAAFLYNLLDLLSVIPLLVGIFFAVFPFVVLLDYVSFFSEDGLYLLLLVDQIDVLLVLLLHHFHVLFLVVLFLFVAFLWFV